MKRKYNRATEKFMRSSFPPGAIQLFRTLRIARVFKIGYTIILICQSVTHNCLPCLADV